MKTITINLNVANAARKGIDADYELLTLSTGFAQGVADKEFRTSFVVGKIAGILKLTDVADACTVYAKAGILSRKTDETDAEWKTRQATRKAAIKAGTIAEKTLPESLAEAAARRAFSRFCADHTVTPENKKRGKPGANKKESGEDVTPAANNAKTADSFIRQQCAMLTAYGEKNRAMLSPAMLFAIAEFAEAVQHVQTQD